jgi:integrase
MAEGSSEQLWLFNCGGVDVSALRARRDALLASVRAGRTVAAYGSDWRQFQVWCANLGYDALPTSVGTLELYVTWMFENGRKVSTVERHVSAISHFHRRADAPSPINSRVRDVIRATRRERKEKPEGKQALDALDLGRVAQKCDVSTALGARDRALLVLGFATAFRRSELARLQLADIAFQHEGLAVLLRFSKRDQEGKGRLIAVWKGERDHTDPVLTLRTWLRLRGNWAGPLFCRIQTGGIVTRDPVSGEAINEVVKRRIADVGIDPAGYGAHSLRAGAITASAALGRSDQELMDLSGHSTAKIVRVYVRGKRLFAGRNPLAGVL